ncbi:SgcJ/EcaC family oxidoreductase [Paenibacillus thermotolerans]|uniref:SgcJ/EcaC family oxidoreductase n=1 Tax=Paenibacillus thermotolerans TaxID=3027807 RepID=UPI002368D9FD|nr:MULTISPECIES: SgcJ/EcaC family oxidoreductase [unclassified Paenibacillus]
MNEVRAIYSRLLDAWNNQSARGMAELFAEEGEMIGYDGSEATGPDEIFSHLEPIFRDHPTARFVSKVRAVRLLAPDAFMLRAIAGMIPRGKTDINPAVNTHHTLIVVHKNENWKIALFQNTPAQFHGRPELVERMTEQLRAEIGKPGS